VTILERPVSHKVYTKVAVGTLREKCEELGGIDFSIASTIGLVFGSNLPRIMDRDWDIHHWRAKVEYIEIISALQRQDPPCDKPNAFVD
jgi:hypothetical protein